MVSWPGTAVMVWVAMHKTRRHVDRSVTAQNKLIEDITAAQTSQILSGTGPSDVSQG